MNKLRQIFIAIFLVVLVIASIIFAYSFVSDSKYSESFVIDDPKLQDRFVAELKTRQLDFILDEDGQIWFSEKDRKIVHSVAFEIMREGK